jgi:hypothetical protein
MHLYTYVTEEGGDGEVPFPETPSLLSYTLRYISFAVVGSVCRVELREPIHLCTCVYCVTRAKKVFKKTKKKRKKNLALMLCMH